MLPLSTSIQEFGIVEGSRITMVLGDRLKIFSTQYAFALVRANGSVVTWGDADGGGDSSAVRQQLADISSISSTWSAFAAIKADGSVVTWGDADGGGDSSAVRQQ